MENPLHFPMVKQQKKTHQKTQKQGSGFKWQSLINSTLGNKTNIFLHCNQTPQYIQQPILFSFSFALCTFQIIKEENTKHPFSVLSSYG